MSNRTLPGSAGLLFMAFLCACAGIAGAQTSSSVPDSVRLADLQSDAVRRDPRARELQLLSAQSSLRQEDISATRLPVIGANGQAQYQSQVITIPFRLPSGAMIPSPSRDTYDAHLQAQQPLFDPALGARRSVESATLAASQATVRSALFTLRQSVNDAYFGVLLQQAQMREQQLAISELEAQKAVAADRVKHGMALPSETAMLQAEILSHKQALGTLAATRQASLEVLADLTGSALTDTAVLAAPNLTAQAARARQAIDTISSRPEYEQFALNRDVLREQRASLGAGALPRISAFGRAGYGRPALDPFSRDFSTYWLAGVQVEWTPWNWGTTRRDRDALTIQQQIVTSEEAAFRATVRRSVALNLANMDQLERTLASDDTIIALRQAVLRETQYRFNEGVVTSADYVSRETDLFNARIQKATHGIQLAQARANFLTTLGLEVR